MAFDLLYLVLFTIGLLCLYEVLRRYKYAVVFFYLILPVLLLSVWRNSGIDSPFEWIKLFTITFAVLWVSLCRYTKLNQQLFARFITASLVAVNIFEAVVQDASSLKLSGILNAAAGLLCILTLSQWQKIDTDKSKIRDMTWPSMTLFWIFAYTIWNWVFTYLNFPEHAAYGISVLSVSIIPSLWKKSAWLQARSFTLAAYYMYLFTFTRFIDAHAILLPQNEALKLVASVVSFMFCFAQAFSFLRHRWMRAAT